MYKIYTKEADNNDISLTDKKQNVTLPFIYDNLADTNFEPQFIRQRSNNIGTFYQGDFGASIASSGQANLSLSGQSIFLGSKRLQLKRVVLNDNTICNIRSGNNTLRVGIGATIYEIVFNENKIDTVAGLLAFINGAQFTITPIGIGPVLSITASAEPFNPNGLRINFFIGTGPVVPATVNFDLTSSMFTNGKAMWGAKTSSTSGQFLTLFPLFKPALYWDFRSVEINKYSKVPNKTSSQNIANVYRYYFTAPNTDSSYEINWNKESLTLIDIQVFDDTGTQVNNGYTYWDTPFIAFELLSEQ